MNKVLKFPKNFLWGSATSAYQVEGGIENCDWSKVYPARKACDHYHLYEKDFDLLKKLNQNAFRLSIEWSRIEPEQGKFNKKEIGHYRKVLLALKKRKIKSVVTLWHFTNPLWLAKIGGWSNKQAIDYFARYAEVIVEELGNLIDFCVIFNEPLVYALGSYLRGVWPPKRKNPSLFLKVIKNQIVGHKKISKIFRHRNPKIKIGIAKNNGYFEPFNQKSILDKFSCFLARYSWNEYFLNKIKNHLDFIGLNYYFHRKIKFPFQNRNENKLVSDVGREIYPEGIYYCLKQLERYRKPIYITENGIADAKDKLRKDFLKEHLYWVHKAIEEGMDVGGYFHWSLMDNFEWEKGLEPRFGLIDIDYRTLARKVRPSALYYAKICQDKSLIHNS